jgi:hypothetical protein
MTCYIFKMIWVFLFASLIAANASATIITKTHITTTRISVNAQLDTHLLQPASSDYKILKPDVSSIDVPPPGIGVDKTQVLNNMTAVSTLSRNVTFTNGSIAGLSPGVIGLSVSTTVSNETAKSKSNGST